MKRLLFCTFMILFSFMGIKAQQISRFVDNQDSTITDTQTKLMWMKYDYVTIEGYELPGGSYNKALKWVIAINKSNHAGHSDWRLPTAKEFLTLCKVKETRKQYLKYFQQQEKYQEFWSSNRPSKYLATFCLDEWWLCIITGSRTCRMGKKYKFPVAIPSVRLVRNSKQ